MTEFGSYGVQLTTRNSGPVAGLVEELSLRGFAVLPRVLDAVRVAELSASLDGIYEEQCKEIGGEDRLIQMGDADIARCPLAYASRFLELALQPEILMVARAVLGEAVVLLMQNGIINRPDRTQAQTKWHRDLNYQHWVSSKPLALGALVCLEEFNDETGGTVFLPSTHMVEDFPSSDLIEKIEVQPAAPAGSVIFFNSMIFHRAGVNRSGRVRRAVNHVIGAPILAQAVDIPAMLGEVPADLDGFAQAYLGYRWNPVPSVRDWRLMKLSHL